MTKENAYKHLGKTIKRFESQIDTFKKSDYNEHRTRRDFIEPFFEAFGWNFDNRKGVLESYREVNSEDKIKVGDAIKAPDYAFRDLTGKRLFFVEAKKPSIVVKNDIEPAYQVRRYGWSAKLPISIVTDFEEFAIYDCTQKPKVNDKANTSRIKYLTYDQYLENFDFLWENFAKENVLSGSLSKYKQHDNKKGSDSVDNEFLNSLDFWRKTLASSIASSNVKLDDEEINFAVQQTIDRIIFLRIAEDRNVEPYGTLKNTIKSGNFYKNLFEIFKEADAKYNSGLFDFRKDQLSENLRIDDKVIKSVINDLYFPISPYAFSVIPVEILGSAYEQFLGKVIRITPSRNAKIEEKPEVRKAGGVYYTPQYVVDYIVKNTIGKLVKGKTPKEVAKLRILDPACGSGSFLIGAYQYLLDWHLDYYTNTSKSSIKNLITPDGNLTTSEKKRILLNNIYGVDIDANAAEVTKLSLLLKCMEGETNASIRTQLNLFKERVLPTLDENIKVGNSLVGTDYFSPLFDFGEGEQIRPFDWKKGFPNIFSNGGFDVVIGNPPYVMLQNQESREAFDYALKKYKSAKYKIDTYQLFTEQSIHLLKPKGLLGFITPNTFLKNIHSEPLRRFILDNVVINEIVLFNYSVFQSASVDTCILIISKEKYSNSTSITIKKVEVPFEPKEVSNVKQSSFETNNRIDFNLTIDSGDSAIISKILKKSTPLSKYCGAYFGIQTFDRSTYVSDQKKNKHYEPIIDGGNIEPFFLKPSTEYVNYIPSAIKSGGSEVIYRQNRICIRQIGSVPIATFVPANIFTLNTIYNVYLLEKGEVSLHFLLGIINSNVVRYYWKKNNSDEKKTFPKIKKEAILSIPIPIIDGKNKEITDEITSLVTKLLQLNSEKSAAKLPSKVTSINNQIEYCLDRINELVYGLFGLNKGEISVVEKLLQN